MKMLGPLESDDPSISSNTRSLRKSARQEHFTDANDFVKSPRQKRQQQQQNNDHHEHEAEEGDDDNNNNNSKEEQLHDLNTIMTPNRKRMKMTGEMAALDVDPEIAKHLISDLRMEGYPDAPSTAGNDELTNERRSTRRSATKKTISFDIQPSSPQSAFNNQRPRRNAAIAANLRNKNENIIDDDEEEDDYHQESHGEDAQNHVYNLNDDDDDFQSDDRGMNHRRSSSRIQHKLEQQKQQERRKRLEKNIRRQKARTIYTTRSGRVIAKRQTVVSDSEEGFFYESEDPIIMSQYSPNGREDIRDNENKYNQSQRPRRSTRNAGSNSARRHYYDFSEDVHEVPQRSTRSKKSYHQEEQEQEMSEAMYDDDENENKEQNQEANEHDQNDKSTTNKNNQNTLDHIEGATLYERLRPRRTNASYNYSHQKSNTQPSSRLDSEYDQKGYSLRRKDKKVDYSVFYMPKKSQLKQDDRLGRLGVYNSYNDYRYPRSPQKNRPKYASSDDEDFPQYNKGKSIVNQSSLLQPDKAYVPMNMVDLVMNQELSLIQLLPEEEREKYEKDKITFLGASKKTSDIPTQSFEDIGGLEEHIRSLKEMVSIPLLYPQIFEKFNISPPRGVLFYGPPGTGKTMMARSLASSCSTSTKKVAFFVRKGADILSKYVGEAEKQLRQLFDQAKQWQPSIIFFDEIDGLAPARSMSKQDHTHSSVVSTLLALMDGLDNRGQVVVIGATNRIDTIDPALRRPGRFDREFYFPLPDEDARQKIIKIATKNWKPHIPIVLQESMAKLTKGYCGADVKALCTEAALNSVRRTYPSIYSTFGKIAIDVNRIQVGELDFIAALKKFTSASQKSQSITTTELPSHLHPLLGDKLIATKKKLDDMFPHLTKNMATLVSSLSEMQSVSHSAIQTGKSLSCRVLVTGQYENGQKYFASALLEYLTDQKYFVQSLDLSFLMSDSARTIESSFNQTFHELKRHKPSVLYLPNIDLWWMNATSNLRVMFLNSIQLELPDHVLFLATSETPLSELDLDLQPLFKSQLLLSLAKVVVELDTPTENQKIAFFEPIFKEIEYPTFKKPLNAEVKAVVENSLKVDTSGVMHEEPILVEATQEEQDAEDPDVQQLEKEASKDPFDEIDQLPKEELDKLILLTEQDEQTSRRLRHELRGVTDCIRKDRAYKDFTRPVSSEQYPDYYDIIEKPLSLQDIYYKINSGAYVTPQDYIDDIQLILENASTYCSENSDVVEKARSMKDQVLYMLGHLDADFVWECKQVYLKKRIARIIKERKEKEERRQQRLSKSSKRGRRSVSHHHRTVRHHNVIETEEEENEEENDNVDDQEESEGDQEPKEQKGDLMAEDSQQIVLETESMQDVIVETNRFHIPLTKDQDFILVKETQIEKEPQINNEDVMLTTKKINIIQETTQVIPATISKEDQVIREEIISMSPPTITTVKTQNDDHILPLRQLAHWSNFKGKLMVKASGYSLMKLEEVFSLLCIRLEELSHKDDRFEVLKDLNDLLDKI